MADHLVEEGYYADPNGPDARNVDAPVVTDAYGNAPGTADDDDVPGEEKKTTSRRQRGN